MGKWSKLISGASSILGAIPGVGVIPAIAGNAIAGIVGSLEAESQQDEEYAWQAKQAQLNRDFQREERLASQEYNEKMWHMQNEYNSPVNQLKLLQEAGINPNTALGSSNPFVKADGVTTSPSSGSLATAPGTLASSMLATDPQSQLIIAQARKTNAEAKGLEIDNQSKPTFNEKQLKLLDGQIDKIGKENALTEEQTNQLKELTPLLKGKTAAEIQEIQQKTNLVLEEISIAQEQKRKASAEANIAANEEDLSNWRKTIREKWGVELGSSFTDVLLQLLLQTGGNLKSVSKALSEFFGQAIDDLQNPGMSERRFRTSGEDDEPYIDSDSYEEYDEYDDSPYSFSDVPEKSYFHSYRQFS